MKKFLLLIILIIGLSSCCTLSDPVYVPEYYPVYYPQRVVVVHPVHRPKVIKQTPIHRINRHSPVRNNGRNRRKR